MRSEVECRAYMELHSALSQVMRYSESRQKKGAPVQKQPIKKSTGKKTPIKNISHHQPPSYATCAAALLAAVFGSMTRPSMP